MDEERIAFLEGQARGARKHVIKSIAGVGAGHIGGSLSIVDLLTVLYYEVMNIDPANPQMEGRDRLGLSKGHAGPGLYAILAMKGYFPEEWLYTLNEPDTRMPSHCDMVLTPGIDMTAGSLGQGICCAVGMAIGAKIKGGKEYIYAIIGDGESQEGSVWEASMSAVHFKLDNLIVFLDHNGMQVDGMVEDIMALGDPMEKWKAFGFNMFRADGHDMDAIKDTILAAQAAGNGKPSMIVLDTVKGKGAQMFEEMGFTNHNFVFTEDLQKQVTEDVDKVVN